MSEISGMPPAAVIQARVSTALALPSRLRHTALLLVATAMAGVTGALALTEPGLPLRTRLALGALAVGGVAWAMFAGWVLARREVLFGRHRLIAGWMAVGFSAVLTMTSAVAAWMDRRTTMWLPATGVGVVMLILAAVLLHRAHGDVRALRTRRDALRAALETHEVAS
ncbi:MAG: hypothetical protein IT357_06890 [Gemmatimonadaceae bacterium]|nr:hypothetical protein [Gemmatimonadaceae bacterium]